MTVRFAAELDAALDLARRAGEIALEVYGRDFTPEQKADRSPVTEADRRVEELIVPELQDSFPGDLVVGEESGFDGAHAATRAWFVDPVDGTKDFIKKNGEWSVMIGFAREGVGHVGVVHEPATGRLTFAATGEGAWQIADGQRRRLHGSDAVDPGNATLVRSRSHPDPRIDQVRDRVGIGHEYRHGSVGCKLAHIAEGRADVYFNFSGRCYMWDTCAPEVIIREAGGDLVDFDGSPIVYAGLTTRVTKPFVAVSNKLRAPVLSALREMRSELQPED